MSSSVTPQHSHERVHGSASGKDTKTDISAGTAPYVLDMSNVAEKVFPIFPAISYANTVGTLGTWVQPRQIVVKVKKGKESTENRLWAGYNLQVGLEPLFASIVEEKNNVEYYPVSGISKVDIGRVASMYPPSLWQSEDISFYVHFVTRNEHLKKLIVETLALRSFDLKHAITEFIVEQAAIARETKKRKAEAEVESEDQKQRTKTHKRKKTTAYIDLTLD
ncbi:hypothetical protein EJ08DRAFT_111490 [Tothia fuscella]|uniref:Uncharacterized protein n=1 Tax=Tothia fuscella TaxID=1048955 RepID=A0A9P4NUX2_9PEZI|nr:hypothetical protein EJ08DRAFT_111490 [Tothia fuscella]